MAFTHRLATLAAVVAIPLGVAATSYALTDDTDPPKTPSKVELESGSPEPAGSSPAPATSRPAPTGDEVVPPPPATADDQDDDADDGPEQNDDAGGGRADDDRGDD
ncbi:MULTISPECIES: small secreted hydrophilic protein [unclassified Streptomyces]|uniref:small secreted hydrophilic protein n=1 Tax=unclassified Streptomyces TaxID=2593676 RepID=UPI000BF88D04|nr:small secreted hydrophilic protein [Streptomyces sp. Ru87]PGH51743.1 small secreted hydrophilic protein [Streptomyces sp. Ru87]